MCKMKNVFKVRTLSLITYFISGVLFIAIFVIFLLESKIGIGLDYQIQYLLNIIAQLSLSIVLACVIVYVTKVLGKLVSLLDLGISRYVSVCIDILLLVLCFAIIANTDADNLEIISYKYGLIFKDSVFLENMSPSSQVFVDTIIGWGCVVILTELITFAFSIVVLVGDAKELKKQKELKRKQQEICARNLSIGFVYEESEYYRQTHIPYEYLNQVDGTLGEFVAYCVLMNNGFRDAKFIFNRKVPRGDGLSNEIDLIMIHCNGIFVLENKHYSNRVCGKSIDYNLKSIDKKGREYSFYNPIWQNEKHVEVLKQFLISSGEYTTSQLPQIYSVVCFTDLYDRSDYIISGIDLQGCKSIVCTSQNLGFVIKSALDKNTGVFIDVNKINSLLESLPIYVKHE